MQKLNSLLKAAYERELYERWLTLYPYMEIQRIEFLSFEDYKNKFLSNTQNDFSDKTITNEEIQEEMLEVVKYYEQKAGETKDGNI